MRVLPPKYLDKIRDRTPKLFLKSTNIAIKKDRADRYMKLGAHLLELCQRIILKKQLFDSV